MESPAINKLIFTRMILAQTAVFMFASKFESRSIARQTADTRTLSTSEIVFAVFLFLSAHPMNYTVGFLSISVTRCLSLDGSMVIASQSSGPSGGGDEVGSGHASAYPE